MARLLCGSFGLGAFSRVGVRPEWGSAESDQGCDDPRRVHVLLPLHRVCLWPGQSFGCSDCCRAGAGPLASMRAGGLRVGG